MQVTGSGDYQHMPSDRVEAAQERFGREVEYAEKAETHVWIIIVTHRLTDAKAKEIATSGPETTAMLDVETVAVTGIGCYRCERELDARLVGKRCPGEPKS